MTGLLEILGSMALVLITYFIYQRFLGPPSPSKSYNTSSSAKGRNLTNDAIQNNDSDKIIIRLVFGTQTGTAENMAKELKSRINELYNSDKVKVIVEEINSYQAEVMLPKERYIFFFVATYGDGEPTDTAIEFDAWMDSSAEEEEEILDGVKFGVMALGNREYEHFCTFGKKVDRLMEQLGATRIVDRTDGDDSKNIEDDFDDFAERAIAALTKDEFLQPFVTTGAPQKLTKSKVPAYKVIIHEKDNQEIKTGIPAGAASKFAKIAVSRELHSELSDRSCVHIELDISETGLAYETGDHVAIYPENDPEIVEQAVACLGLSMSTVFTLELPQGNPDGLEKPFSGPITLKAALAKYADLTSPPNKLSLKYLSAFAENPKEAEELLLLSSHEGKDKFAQMVQNNMMSLLELMQAFPSAVPDLGSFFGSICLRVQPRYYSISSSPLQSPNHIHVTAAVVHETKPSGKIHKGVCTNWLSTRRISDTAPIHVRKSHFKLPADPTTPIIMVGPGTGIAPFRGFLQERAKLNSKGVTLGPALLFFGCRNREMDYIYQEELEGYLNDGTLTGLHVAFSRETSQKVYVQHKLMENKEEVWRLLDGNKGYFYVCGEAGRMARDVHRTLHEIAEQVGGISSSSAEQLIKGMGDKGRYQKDIW